MTATNQFQIFLLVLIVNIFPSFSDISAYRTVYFDNEQTQWTWCVWESVCNVGITAVCNVCNSIFKRTRPRRIMGQTAKYSECVTCFVFAKSCLQLPRLANKVHFCKICYGCYINHIGKFDGHITSHNFSVHLRSSISCTWLESAHFQLSTDV